MVRRKYVRSRASNLTDYTDLLRAGGLLCSFLWPIYGWFCRHVLELQEAMGARLFLMASYIGLWSYTRQKPLGNSGRWFWIGLNAMGMVWLPWSLYLRTDRSDYWQLSIIFFSIALALCVRGLDLLFALAIGAAAVIWQFHAQLVRADVILLPVAGITLLGTYISLQVLRAARRRIEEQSVQILSQNQKLLELHRRKDEFTASVAHDLRTPLAVAMSLSEDLAEAEMSLLARRKLESLSQALRQMRRQSEDLLDLERFSLGVARFDPIVLDICAWLRRFEEGFASMARARGLSFQIILGQRQLMVKFDPIRMEAALFNLVSNAFKFTPPDGHVEVHLRKVPEKGICIAVLDDGEGIPPDALPRIFDRYEQVDRGPGTYTAGVGIGLALVREIAEIHGGRVQVQSTLGLGSLFEILLDDVLVESEIVFSEPPVGSRSGSFLVPHFNSGNKLVLVVEDQLMLRQLLREVLEPVARIATASDGNEALKLVQELRPDVIVSDLSMPGMNGLELLTALRADPALNGIPVVILSGDVVSLRGRLREEPGLALMQKPFDQNKLRAVVERMMSRPDATTSAV